MKNFLIGLAWLMIFGLLFAWIAGIADDSVNGGLPLVQSSAPKRSFNCSPSFLPRIRPVKPQEVA